MTVPLRHNDQHEWLQLIARNVNAIENGKTLNGSTCTLSASTTTTNVADRRVGINSKILLMPTSATAAAEFGTIYVSAVTKEQFTLTHLNTADVDKTFFYIVVG